MSRARPKPVHRSSQLGTVPAPDMSLPAVLGRPSSASRMRRAPTDSELGGGIGESLASFLAEHDDLELALPSKLGLESFAPPMPATISLSPLADQLEPDEAQDIYRMIRTLGVGGMATVYEAVREGTDGFRKRVALKRIHDHLALDSRIVELLVDEARLASLIEHPNVCQVLDFGVDGSGHFLALEYLDGFTLRDVFNQLTNEPNHLEDQRHQLIVARIVAGLAEGLHAAHELTDDAGTPLEVVHRDVSPHNLFVLRSGAVKVADFGVARARNQIHHTSTGALKGKLAYASPEQLHRRPLDRRTDIFSLGVVTWEMLTGQRLFEAESEAATIARICDAPAPDVRVHQPQIVASIAAVVKKALSIDPDDRFKTARDMARAIERALTVQQDSVPATDLSEWLVELMGTRSDPRASRPPDELLEVTGSVSSADLEPIVAEPSKEEPRDISKKPALNVTPPAATPLAAGAPAGRPSSRSLLAIGGAALALALACGIAWYSLGHRALNASQPTPITLAPVPAAAAPANPIVPAVPVVPAPATPAARAAPVVPAPSSPAPTPAAQAPTQAPSAASPRLPTGAARTIAPSNAVEPSAPAEASLRQFGSVLVTVQGRPADVLVDGRNFGRAPQRVTLPVGTHSVAIAAAGGGVSTATSVKIEAGVSTFITLSTP